MICGSGGSKSRLGKAAGAETSGRMRNENCTPLWREGHLEVKGVKARRRSRTTLLLEVKMSIKCTLSWRESHLEVESVKNTSDHFCKLRCRKSTRPCGAKHMSKSKCTKQASLSPLLDVQDEDSMLEKCTPLPREHI